MKFRTTLSKKIKAEIVKGGLRNGVRINRPCWEFYETELGVIAAFDRNADYRFINTGFAWKGGRTILKRELAALGIRWRI